MRLTYYDERVIEQLAARTQLTGEQTVVDVGTGTGFVAAGLAAHAHRVLGFDNASSMLEVARANLDRLGVDNVELAELTVCPNADHFTPVTPDGASRFTATIRDFAGRHCATLSPCLRLGLELRRAAARARG